MTSSWYIVAPPKWRHCNTYSGIGSKYFFEKKYVAIFPRSGAHDGERNLLLSASKGLCCKKMTYVMFMGSNEHHYPSCLDSVYSRKTLHLICEPARCLGRGWRAFSGNIPHRASVGLAPLYVHRTAMGIHQKCDVDESRPNHGCPCRKAAVVIGKPGFVIWFARSCGVLNGDGHVIGIRLCSARAKGPGTVALHAT